MKKSIVIICYCLLLSSCATEKKVKNRDLIKLNSSLNETFTNNNSSKQNETLTSLFDMDFQKDNQVGVIFDKDCGLKIRYKDQLGGIRYRCFKGKFKRKCFEIYLEKYRKGFPLIVQSTRIDRVRIKMTNDSTLVVDKYINRSGSIFLMAAGYTGTRQFQFKSIKN